jgi:predicted dehydrogenase
VHAQVLRQVEGARLVAVAEPREEVGRGLATSHEAEWCPDLRGLLARPDVHLVILATPSGMHPDQAVEAARAGKHVVTEKPLAITLDGADRMIGAARESAVALACVFQNRFHRDALRLKRAVEVGVLGRPLIANAFVHWHRDRGYYAASGGWRGTYELDGGGALMNQSIHTIDLLQWVMGPVESVSAYTSTLVHPIEAEDTASAALRYTSGALGCIQGMTSAHRDRPARLEVVGDRGSATLEGSKLSMWEPCREAELLSARELEATCEPVEGDPWWQAHVTQMRLIFEALRAGAKPPVPGEEARRALEIVLAIYHSARTGERTSLPFRG